MTPLDADGQFIGLYENHYDEILAYCARRTSPADADEAAADVFVVAWRRIDELELETARGWLFGIARGVLANAWRSRSRRTRLITRLRGLAPEPTETLEQQSEWRDGHDEVLGALGRLRELDREVLMLSVWEGLTAREIAQVLDVSIAAAEQRIHRAKKRLAKSLSASSTHIGGSRRGLITEEEAHG